MGFLGICRPHIGPSGGSFFTDCQSLVKAWNRGQANCCDVLSIYSSIWPRIWDKVLDIGEDNAAVAWVPAHLAEAMSCDKGLPTW